MASTNAPQFISLACMRGILHKNTLTTKTLTKIHFGKNTPQPIFSLSWNENL